MRYGVGSTVGSVVSGGVVGWVVGCVVGGANGADSMTAMMNSWAIVSGVVAAESAASYAK